MAAAHYSKIFCYATDFRSLNTQRHAYPISRKVIRTLNVQMCFQTGFQWRYS